MNKENIENPIRVFFNTKENKMFECFPNKTKKVVEMDFEDRFSRIFNNQLLKIDEEQIETLLNTINTSSNKTLLNSCSSTVELCFNYGLINENVYKEYKDKISLK